MRWIDAFRLAIICRDTARITMLARIPVSLLRAFGGRLDEYAYAWVEPSRASGSAVTTWAPTWCEPWT
ncbi:Imm49 family immunity protein [Streptomyces sp. A0592]|uniref:Imm49 family immunity protein n=1 Tax=Streptomyces sp. A0592 TaxID=2563099 RepID=UPI001F0E55F3|nr:Imm49 family immunity protein [Streptomyces sp. A0592]